MPCKGCGNDCKCTAEKCGEKCTCGKSCKCHCCEGHGGHGGEHGEGHKHGHCEHKK